MTFRQVFAVIGVLVVSLALAGPAAGQQSSPVTEEQYAEVVGGGGGNLNDPSDPGDPSSTENVGSLPFTGLDLGLMAAAAAGLVAAGIVMRRRSGGGEHGA